MSDNAETPAENAGQSDQEGAVFGGQSAAPEGQEQQSVQDRGIKNQLLAERLRQYPRKRRAKRGSSPRIDCDDCTTGIVAIASTVRGCTDILECVKGACKRIMTVCNQGKER